MSDSYNRKKIDFNTYAMEITEIKSSLQLETVLQHYNLKPDANNRLCCPWHDDKTPSLQLYLKTNTWTCFSSNCTAGSGDVIDFVMRMEKGTKHEALVKCKELIGSAPKPSAKPKPSTKTISDDLSRITVLSKFYNGRKNTFKRSEDARAYALSRGLPYDGEHFLYMGKVKDLRWTGELRDSIIALGIQIFKRCLLFAMRNESGQIVNLYGRSIFGDKGSKHYYLKGKLQGLYPRWPSKQTQRLILCESHIDTVTVLSYVSSLSDGEMGMAWQCLSLYGTNGFTADHIESIGQLEQLEEVVLFLDGDAAGQEAIRKLSHKIRDISTDIRVSYVATPEGDDPNSLIVKTKESERSTVLTELIEKRKELIFSSSESSIEESKAGGQANNTELPWDEGIESNRQAVTDRGQLHTDHAELLVYTYGRLQISLLGGIKVTGLDRMRVTVKVERRGSSIHLPIRHSLDLYHAKQVDQLAVMISDQLDMAKGQIELLLSYMTSALESYRAKRLDLLKPKQPVGYEMSVSARNTAIQYLKSGSLWDRTIEDIAETGIIGERSNALIAYMAYTSRKREKPLHIMCLGASGTGKTYLQEKIGALIPDEEKIEITSLSDNALYYFGRTELKHKLILIEDLDGAENVLYPLRELQSKRRISKTVTTKDNKGNLKTLNLTVEGPVSVSGCTTRERIYEDNANRCILLYIDDSKAQDRRIMDYQRKASAGVISTVVQERKKFLLQDVQRVLRPIKVINPYAEYIDLPPEVFKPRRTLLILLSFIETVTYYHQYQRKVHTNQYTGGQYIKSTIKDIELSFELMQPVLFAKSDELSKGCRRFLERLKSVIGQGSSFYSQDIRRQFRLSSSTVHRYIRELKNNGYIRYKGGNRQQGYEYKINDYDEYTQLRSAIDDRLQQIIEDIKNGIPEVSHRQNGINKSQTIKALA